MPCVDAPLVCAVPCAVALMACVCVTPLAGYVCFVILAVVFVLVMCVQCIGQSSRCDGWFPLYLCVCFVAATFKVGVFACVADAAGWAASSVGLVASVRMRLLRLRRVAVCTSSSLWL